MASFSINALSLKTSMLALLANAPPADQWQTVTLTAAAANGEQSIVAAPGVGKALLLCTFKVMRATGATGAGLIEVIDGLTGVTLWSFIELSQTGATMLTESPFVRFGDNKAFAVKNTHATQVATAKISFAMVTLEL